MAALLLGLLQAPADAVAQPADAMGPAPAQAQPQQVQKAARRERGPWLELDAGPAALHRSGVRGLSSGPEVRLSLGVPVGDRVAAELWVAGSMQSLPHGALGDESAAGGGLGGRLKLYDFDAQGAFQLWGRAGAGYLAATTDGAHRGLSAFAGALLLIQPPVRRFSFGLEVDALTVGTAFGLAVLPTLRCAL